MSDDYQATEEDCQKVREWPDADVHGLLDFIASVWWARGWGWTEYEGKEEGQPMRVIHASTGGMSSNEDLMQAFRENWIAYHKCFNLYRRGGHYELSLPAKVKP